MSSTKPPEKHAANKTLLQLLDALELLTIQQDTQSEYEGKTSLLLPIQPTRTPQETIDRLQKAVNTLVQDAYPSATRAKPASSSHQSRIMAFGSSTRRPPEKEQVCPKIVFGEIKRKAGIVPALTSFFLEVTLPEDHEAFLQQLREQLKAKTYNLQIPQELIDWKNVEVPAEKLLLYLVREMATDRAHYPIQDTDKQRVSIPLGSATQHQTDALYDLLNAIKNVVFTEEPRRLTANKNYNILSFVAVDLQRELKHVLAYLEDPKHAAAVSQAIQKADPDGKKQIEVGALFADALKEGLSI